MTKRLALSLIVLFAFVGFTVWCAETEGPLGFLSLALERKWGMQMFLDVGLSLGVASFWMVPDAKKHGLNPWPFVVACLGVGSIAALSYIVVREAKVALARNKAPKFGGAAQMADRPL